MSLMASESAHPAAAPEASVGHESLTSLTYGIELEFVFAFHEALLTPEIGITAGREDQVKKDLPYHIREVPPFTKINPVDLPHHAYNSWGVLPGSGDEIPLRPYEKEPVNILRDILLSGPSSHHLIFKTFGTMMMQDKMKDKYNDWLICKDHSVCGVGSHNIFPGRLASRSGSDCPERWDSIGLEVVSTVYDSGSNIGARDINLVVDLLNGGGRSSKSGAFITNQCALHVHVQAPEELEVLQELAIIILIYEEAISRLHPPCRRPHHKKGLDGPRGNCDSNRLFWVLPTTDQTMPARTSKPFDNLDRTLVGLKRHYTSIDVLKQAVRDQDSRDKLALAMNAPAGKRPHHFGTRNRIVNFTTTADRGEQFPQTIEFRQARGSLDGAYIMHWVKFCVGLVRVAAFYKNHPGRFPVQDWPDVPRGDGDSLVRTKIDVFDLIRDMQLGDEETNYWERMQATWQAGQPGDADDRTDNELPPSTPQGSSAGSDGGHGDGGSGDDDGFESGG